MTQTGNPFFSRSFGPGFAVNGRGGMALRASKRFIPSFTNRGCVMIRKLVLGVMVVLAAASVRHADADILFVEDWNTGSIDSGKWTLQSVGGGPFVFDLGAAGLGPSGDYGLFLRDASFTYTAGVRSTSSFARNAGPDGVKASFKLLRDQGTSLDFTSVGGPWTKTDAPSGALSDLEDIEAGISTNQPNGNTYYVENAPAGNNWATTPLSSAFFTAFANATSKASALDVSVTLGPSTGALIEWSVNGGPTTIEFDTIGLNAGDNWGGANRVSDLTPVRLFFGGVGNGTSFASAVIDDIVVESVPEPMMSWAVGLGIVTLAMIRRRARRYLV